MPKIRIRKMRPSDFLAIRKLFSDSKKASHWTKKSFKRIISIQYNAHFVAVQSNQIVGVVFGISDGADVGYLYKLQVDSQFQKHGIASRLVKRAALSWKKYKLRLVFGRVASTNMRSKKLFEKYGFRMLSSKYRLMDYGV